MRRILSVAAMALLLASSAAARDTDVVLPIQDAIRSDLAGERLTDLPFYFSGQPEPTVKKELSVNRVQRSTRGVFRSDARACEVAFLSVLRELQTQAQTAGADAIVGIRSTTDDKPLESPTQYRCLAGATIVHVELEGTLVEVAD